MTMPLVFARTRAFICRKHTRRELPRLHPYRYLSSASIIPDATNRSTDGVPSNISPINTSLALSVYFRHPDLGMKDYEILSRATAFLLQVDPPELSDHQTKHHSAAAATTGSKSHVKKSAFPHLQENIELRKKLLRKQDYKYDPAGGPPRLPHQLNWLEFCPTAFRPKVHVVSSSHVISPWLWPKYYGQNWLQVVTQEHVRYSLEVWGKSSDKSEGSSEEEISHDGKLNGSFEPVAKFALNPYPIHHPKDMDVAVIHLKQEDKAIEHLMNLGIRPLHLPSMHDLQTSNDPVFEPGERVVFQGFEVYEANTTDKDTLTNGKTEASDDVKDDERVFHPYSSIGTLTMASPDRFLAHTKAGPLPEGLCGGPAIQLPRATKFRNNSRNDRTPMTIRGVVEGIVSTNHENAQLAGMASFLPCYRVREFVDYAERVMLEQIIDEDLFEKIVDMKEKKDKRGTTYETGQDGDVYEIDKNDKRPMERKAEDDDKLPNDSNLRSVLEGTSEDVDTPHIDAEYQEIITSLRENHTPKEVDAILATVEREREEVIKIMESEGGDIDDVIEAVRTKTYEEKNRIMAEIEKKMIRQKNIMEGGKIVSPAGHEKQY
eukprot:CAMPEP_0172531550 /NCGR_PEP_ID=MMETSP1067-20121228/4912_1 /TAXON_ID=265564 ORGANISM="Thalassiosira punctigera, Strain Tpunct2005C2" /NCGR_SAMPLE_ID=MMETSP1067 /ASSEMBLY_ACC=CAM_ASM_000444 /LENGTH=601 /DNA_ID=CAMNT_0013315941 /DNA_START=23 /DNA_END=1828 /DNA_ORIENTATION=+